MKKYLITSIILATACLMLLFSGCSDDRGTRGLTKDYFEKNIFEVLSDSVDLELVFGNNNPFEALFDDNETISVTLEADLNKYLGKDMDFIFRTDIDSENKRGTLNLTLKDPSYESIDFMLFADREKLLLSSDALFGNGNVYSLQYRDFDKLKSEFAKSYIASSLGIAEEDVYKFCDDYGIDGDYFKKAAYAVNKYVEFCEEFSEASTEIMRSNFEKICKEITERELELNGEVINVLVLNAELREEYAKEFIDEYIKEYALCIEKQVEMFEAVIPQKLRTEMSFDAEGIKNETIESMRSSLEQIVSQTDCSADMNFYLDKKNGALRKMTMENDVNCLSVYLDDEIKFEYSDNSGTLSTGRIYHTEDAGIKAYGFELFGSDDPLERTEGRFEILKFENQYNLYVRTMYGNEIVGSIIDSSGYLSYGESSFEIKPQYISSEYEVFYPGLSLGVSHDAFIMEHKKHKSIFALTEDEVFGILGRAVNSFTELFGASQNYEYEGSLYA
ncbi:MAG: hypothetical protein IJO52_11055 [Clostridia bacterium]|nr:hypothetical protein [Clostridia bacterium]